MAQTAERRRGQDPSGQTLGRGPPAGPGRGYRYRRPRRRPWSIVAAGLAGAVGLGLTVWLTTAGGSNVALPSPPAPGATAPGAPAAAAALAAGVEPAVVDVVSTFPGGSGTDSATGMVLSRSGLVVTSAHVIELADTIRVDDPVAHRGYAAQVLGYDPAVDVALLQLQGASALTPIRSRSSGVAVGEGVVAVGNAYGANGPLVYVGGSIVGLAQAVSVADPVTGAVQTLSGLIETNAPVVSGDSGGALVDSAGNVVAMIAAGNGDFVAERGQTRGYAVPIGQVMAVVYRIAPGARA